MVARKFDRYMVAVTAGTHPKFARLTDAERCAHFLGVLAVAAMAPERGCLLVGKLPAEAIDVARAAGVSEKVARSAIDKLRAVGVLEPDRELRCLRVRDWEDYNPPPKTDATNAERQAKHRARNAENNAAVTPTVTSENNGRNAAVTPDVTISPPHPPLEGEGEVEGPPYPPQGGTREVDHDVLRLCRQLAARMVANDPKAKPAPDSNRWQRDMRLLLQDRRGDVAEVERIIDWCQHDPFWQSNILSPAKLRKQFTQLLLRSQKDRMNVVAIRPSAGDLIRKLREAEESRSA